MNRDEQFEQRLSRQPVKTLPPGWRDEILAAARAAELSCPLSPVPRQFAWWREMFAFHPRAWATLGAAWVVIVVMNFSVRDASPSTLAQSNLPSAPRMQNVLRQKQQLFAELAGLSDQPVADRPKVIVPRPRSQWHSDAVNV